MAIAKRSANKPKVEQKEKAVDDFINGAPDSTKQTAGLMAGRRRQITHAIFQEKLDALDAMSAQMGISRAALINIGIDQVLNRGVSFGGKD
jgi:hypothetical protein